MASNRRLCLPKIECLADLQTYYQENGKLGAAPEDLWVFELSIDYGVSPELIRSIGKYLSVDEMSFLLSLKFDLNEVIKWDIRDIQMMIVTESARNLAREEMKGRDGRLSIQAPKYNRHRP